MTNQHEGEVSALAHSPTAEQTPIIAACAAGGSAPSLMIRAGAGCGKSSTLQMAAPGIRQLTLCLAFNKSTATELEKRMPSHFQCKSLNALGHRALLQGWGLKSVRIDDRKYGKIVSEVLKEEDIKGKADKEWRMLVQGTKKAMLMGISPDDAGEPLVPDCEASWDEVAEECDWSLEEQKWAVPLVREVLRRGVAAARAGNWAFDDQIYCSVVHGGAFAQWPVVMIDEAQDLNRMNHAMLEKSLAPSGRLIAVGDPNQAIYGFRGALAGSMDKLRGLRQKWLDLPLMTTFRCPKAVVARQWKHVPDYRAAPGNPEGLVVEFGPWDWERVAELPGSGQTAVLCRNNAPLFGMGLKLLRRQIPVQILGRELMTGIVKIINQCAGVKGPAMPKAEFVQRLADWADREAVSAAALGKETRVEQIRDKEECIMTLLDNPECANVRDLLMVLERLFAPGNVAVVLSTIHKAKGLEWEKVVHLDPWRCPSKRAIAEGGEVLVQELNALYVAETRTKHTLVLANLADFGGAGA